jgi:hypothetical protein
MAWLLAGERTYSHLRQNVRRRENQIHFCDCFPIYSCYLPVVGRSRALFFEIRIRAQGDMPSYPTYLRFVNFICCMSA